MAPGSGLRSVTLRTFVESAVNSVRSACSAWKNAWICGIRIRSFPIRPATALRHSARPQLLGDHSMNRPSRHIHNSMLHELFSSFSRVQGRRRRSSNLRRDVSAAVMTLEDRTVLSVSVLSAQPAAHSISAPVDSPIVIQFNQAVDRSSFSQPSSLYVFGRWSGAATGQIQFSNDDRTVTFQPEDHFSAGESVMVVLGNSIRAADGSSIRSAGYSWQFWTDAAQASLN